jgi:hypothetical protein
MRRAGAVGLLPQMARAAYDIASRKFEVANSIEPRRLGGALC